MRLILLAIIALFCLIAASIYLFTETNNITHWIITQQRALQNEMATAVLALRSGKLNAWFILLFSTGTYGFIHALGPGHGKFLIGGVGFGSEVQMIRLLIISFLSSISQSLWAIFLVYGGFSIFAASAQSMTQLAEGYLAPLSYLAILVVGVILLYRGVKLLKSEFLFKSKQDDIPSHSHNTQSECECHAHGPTGDQIAKANSLKDSMALIVSIAMRPCTGAIFLLIIAWNMDLLVAGAAAVIVMGLGTAGLTSLVAISSVAARGLTITSIKGIGITAIAFPIIQIFASVIIIWMSMVLLGFTL